MTALFDKATYVSVFNHFSDEKAFPERVMHHDCKISNILFDKKSNAIICPVDLDTVMPGKFFSDLGDMIRTICCTVDENSTDWTAIAVNENFYTCITETYLDTAGKLFTPQEKAHLHYAGLVLTYMQSLRFMADYLNGNIYYKVAYKEQNLHRAKNQALLLTSLEHYLRKVRHLHI